MTTRKQNLTALRDAMVAGTFTDMIPVYKLFHVHATTVDRAHSGNMNAALAFVAAVLPEWGWRRPLSSQAPDAMDVVAPYLSGPAPDEDCAYFPVYRGEHKTPAVALTIAALNALIELEDIDR